MRHVALLRARSRLAGAGIAVIIAGGLGLSTGSVQVARAAASHSSGQLTFVGESTPHASTGTAIKNRTKRSLDFGQGGSSKVKPTLTVPSVESTAVSSDTGGATGFQGISNIDQASAGTGVYANTGFDLEPPDQGLCVGNGFVLESVNIALSVYSPSGSLLAGPELLNEFYQRPVADFLSDPKCYYDNATGRWFQTILQIDAPGFFDPQDNDRTHVLIAVSKTANPIGAWRLFSLDTTDDGANGTPNHPGCTCLPDQPVIGANADGFYINTNEFQHLANFPYNGSQLYAFGKEKLEASTGSPTFVHFDTSTIPTGDAGLPFWGSLQPATSPTAAGQTHNVEYLLSSGPQDISNNEAPFDNRLVVWALTGTENLNDAHPDVDLVHKVIQSEVYGYGDINTFGATQKSGPTPLREALADPPINDTTEKLEKIAANDTRMQQVVYADGRLFSGVNTLVADKGSKTTRVGIAYFVVRPNLNDEGVGGSIDRQGYIAAEGNNVVYPSIGVTSDGVGTMAFTVSGHSFFPSAGYIRFGEDGPHGPIHITGAGAAPEDGFTGYAFFGFNNFGISRWGDYSAAVATPDGEVWMGAEYIPGGPRDTFANWGTFLSHVSAE